MNTKQSDVSKDKLYQEFNTVVNETEQLLKSVASAGSDKAGALKDGVAQGLAAATEKLEQLRRAAVDQAGYAADATDEYVQGNPWRAVGITAAVAGLAGLVAGLLIARR